jgi:hypothetical protein
MAPSPRPTTLVLKESKFKGEQLEYREDLGYPITPTSHTRNAVASLRPDSTLVSVDCQGSGRPIFYAHIPADGKEISFPEAPHVNPVYEVEISGVLSYRDFVNRSECDAFYRAGRSGVFEEVHEWLRVNGKPLRWKHPSCPSDYRTAYQYRYAERLKDDASSHRYRFLVDGPGGCLAIAFVKQRTWDTPETTTDGHLDVTVRALPAGTPTLEERRYPPKAPPKPPPPPPPPPPTPEDLRKQALELDEIRHTDFTARLLAIARREEQTLAEIERMDITDDNKETYRQEAKDFAANEVARLSAGRREGDSNAKTY